jgi:small subunit ribosomal protein S4e
MHQTRQEVTRKIPITRKGTKYVARASSHLDNSVPLVIAIRDILKLARTAKEVKAMIKSKLLKINGRPVRDSNESIRIFNILEADKKYVLSFLETGRYAFKETKDNERLCKVTSRTLVSGNKIQLNLHDGTNVLGSKGVAVEDSIYLDSSGKIKSHVVFEKGKPAVIISGKYIGHIGKIESMNKETRKVNIKFKDKEAELPMNSVVVQ